MKTKLLGSMAVALALGLAGSAGAQYGGYPAAGYAPGVRYAPGVQPRTVPVHPSLQQPTSQLQSPSATGQPPANRWQQPPPASQPPWPAGHWQAPSDVAQPPVNQWQQLPASQPPWSAGGSPTQPFAAQRTEGQPGFASPQSDLPQSPFAAQPRFLPQPYRPASAGNSDNGAPGAEDFSNGNRPAGNPRGIETELLPEPAAQPNAYSPQPSPAAGQPTYGEYDHLQPSPPGPSGQPPQTYGSPDVAGDPAFNVGNQGPIGSFLQAPFGTHWPGAGGLQHGAGQACGPAGCGPAVTPAPYGLVPLRKWFAGADLLFLTTEENCDRRLLYDVGNRMPTLLSSDDVEPDGDVGFDVFFGRYLHDGCHALMVNYFFFDPDGERACVSEPTAGMGAMGNPYDYRVPKLGWNNISYDVGMDGDTMNDVTVYDWYDDAIAFRVRRDVSFQGIEANFVSFGLGGAKRGGVGPLGGLCGNGCGPRRGCAGTMIPGCNSKLQIRTTHGLRWFQFKDAFDFAASHTDYMYGSTTDDMYYDLDTENNLYGYQFGARVAYALGCRVNVHVGSKFGIFANDAQFRSRIGTREMPAYVNDAYPVIDGDPVISEDSDTVLSTLGELDLGVGYRVNCCWTVRGGYRLYGITGIATTVGSIGDDAGHLPSAGSLCADDSIFLHGGYVGAEYNW